MNILQDEELSPEEVASTGEGERETSPTATNTVSIDNKYTLRVFIIYAVSNCTLA